MQGNYFQPEIECASREVMHYIQSKRLRRLVERCYQNVPVYRKRMDEMGLNREDYEFYLDLRKYGSTRHAGFGLGFERCVMYLTGMSNIRDVLPFPRTVNNCDL